MQINVAPLMELSIVFNFFGSTPSTIDIKKFSEFLFIFTTDANTNKMIQEISAKMINCSIKGEMTFEMLYCAMRTLCIPMNLCTENGIEFAKRLVEVFKEAELIVLTVIPAEISEMNKKMMENLKQALSLPIPANIISTHCKPKTYFTSYRVILEKDNIEQFLKLIPRGINKQFLDNVKNTTFPKEYCIVSFPGHKIIEELSRMNIKCQRITGSLIETDAFRVLYINDMGSPDVPGIHIDASCYVYLFNNIYLREYIEKNLGSFFSTTPIPVRISKKKNE